MGCCRCPLPAPLSNHRVADRPIAFGNRFTLGTPLALWLGLDRGDIGAPTKDKICAALGLGLMMSAMIQKGERPLLNVALSLVLTLHAPAAPALWGTAL